MLYNNPHAQLLLPTGLAPAADSAAAARRCLLSRSLTQIPSHPGLRGRGGPMLVTVTAGRDIHCQRHTGDSQARSRRQSWHWPHDYHVTRDRDLLVTEPESRPNPIEPNFVDSESLIPRLD